MNIDDIKQIVKEEIQLVLKEADKFWMGTVSDKDDFGVPIENEFIDGKTRGGPWAIMTPRSFRQHGSGIGQGRGQKYQKQPDGKWKKIDG